MSAPLFVPPFPLSRPLLQMEHDRVIDTAYLFKREGSPDGTPSLRDVVKATLGLDIQSGAHDSVIDAQVSACFARREVLAPCPWTVDELARWHALRGDESSGTPPPPGRPWFVSGSSLLYPVPLMLRVGVARPFL